MHPQQFNQVWNRFGPHRFQSSDRVPIATVRLQAPGLERLAVIIIISRTLPGDHYPGHHTNPNYRKNYEKALFHSILIPINLPLNSAHIQSLWSGYPVSDGGASGSVLHFFRDRGRKKVRTDPAQGFSPPSLTHYSASHSHS